MLALLVALATAQPVPESPVMDVDGPILSNPAAMSRFAFFELAPSNGRGMTAPCACATPTGAKGETIALARASTAACTKGNPYTGIQVGDVVDCASNQVRVENPGGTGLEIRVENSATNNLLRASALDNAAWTKTATVTADQYTSPANDLTADRVDDTSGVASQGVSQVFVTGSTTKHSVSCLVRGDTATKATISLTGTGNSAGDCSASLSSLSTTTWDRIYCSSASAYAAGLTSITMSLVVGTAAADQGRIAVWRCQHETSAPFPTSPIHTDGVAASRSAGDNLSHTLAAIVDDVGSAAMTFRPLHGADFGTCGTSCGGPQFYAGDGNTRVLYAQSGNLRTYDGTNNPALAATYVALTAKRYCSRWSAGGGWVVRNLTDATSTSSAFTGTAFGGTAAPVLTFSLSGGAATSGWISGICFDRSPSFPCCPP